MLKSINFSVLLCLFIVSACGNNSSSKSNKPNVDNFRGINSVEANETITFRTGCNAEKTEDGKIYQITTFEINVQEGDAATFSMNTSAFYDEKCSFKLFSSDIKGYGSFFYENVLFAVHATHISITPHLPEIADTFNAEAMCGSNSWQFDVSTDIIGTDCVEGSLDADVYTDMSSDGNSATLYMCDRGVKPSNDCQIFKVKKF